jgi:hypothetical protein
MNLPCLRLHNVRSQQTDLRVGGVDGLALEPVRLENLTRRPARSGQGHFGLGYTTRQPSYFARFRIRPPHATVRGHIQAEIRDRQVVFHARMNYQVTRGELHTLRLHLRDWLGDEIRLEQGKQASKVIRYEENRLGPRERIWTVHLPPGVGPRYSLWLTSRVPLDATHNKLFMPNVSDVSAVHREREVTRKPNLVTVGPGLHPAKVRGLKPETAHKRLVRPTQTTTWEVRDPGWRLRMRAQPLSKLPGVELILVDQAAGVVDGQRWAHQASYWVHAERAAELRFGLPAGARLLSVSVDGTIQPARQPLSEEFWLSLPGAGGVHSVRLSWMFSDDAEPVDRPNLARPWLESKNPSRSRATSLWTVHVPTGYQIRRANFPRGNGRRHSAPGQDLYRAAAQFRLSSFLVKRLQKGDDARAARQLLNSQERFAWYCRQAEHALAQPGHATMDTGPNQQSLGDWLGLLRRENLALTRQEPLAGIRVRAEARARARLQPPGFEAVPPGETPATIPEIDIPERGRPAYWQGEDGRDPPRLVLSTGLQQQRWWALVGSGMLLLVLVAGWILSYFPTLMQALQKTWPEQVMLLGLLAWVVCALPLAGIPLVSFGLAARIYFLARRALNLISRAAPIESSPESGATTS